MIEAIVVSFDRASEASTTKKRRGAKRAPAPAASSTSGSELMRAEASTSKQKQRERSEHRPPGRAVCLT